MRPDIARNWGKHGHTDRLVKSMAELLSDGLAYFRLMDAHGTHCAKRTKEEQTEKDLYEVSIWVASADLTTGMVDCLLEKNMVRMRSLRNPAKPGKISWA